MVRKLLRCSRNLLALLLVILMPPLMLVLGWLNMTNTLGELFQGVFTLV